jgi:hypothetical protein
MDDNTFDYSFIDEYEDYIFVSFDEIKNNPNDNQLGNLIRKRYLETLKKSPL